MSRSRAGTSRGTSSRSQATASPTLPRVVFSAVLQSIQPAPVCSRNCLTCWAVMLASVPAEALGSELTELGLLFSPSANRKKGRRPRGAVGLGKVYRLQSSGTAARRFLGGRFGVGFLSRELPRLIGKLILHRHRPRAQGRRRHFVPGGGL